MIKSYKIYNSCNTGLYCSVTPKLAKELNSKDHQLLILKCGPLSVQTKVITTQMAELSEESIGLSKDLLARLKITEGLSLGIKRMNTGQIRLGPVIGILTFPHVITKKRLGIYSEYAKRMAGSGLLYVFSPKGIKRQTNTVSGYHYNTFTNTWERGVFPYPDAVMDRIYPNNLKAHSELEEVIGGNRIFNKKTRIDKLEFYTALIKEPYLQNHLPETRPFNQASDLKYFLEKYPDVFLKPVDSMKGKGIVHVTDEAGKLLCQYMKGNQPAFTKTTEVQEIFKIIKRANGRDRTYIIQAGINRMKCRNRPYGFRVMVTKDGNGNWADPAIFAKAAPPDGFLTNRSLGADYILLNDLFECLKNDLPYTKKDFLDLLVDLSLKTSVALDNQFGPLGKLGLDVVIDISGKPWLIEANGNPGRICPKVQSEFPDWHNQVYDHPLAYAIFLAGFSKSQTV